MKSTKLFPGDPEWYFERIGCVTSSRIADVVAKRKRGDGELACRKNLKTQMIAEMLTGDTTNHFVSSAMQWGIDHETQARMEYERRTGATVIPVGLIHHPGLERCRATPDGWIKPNGLLEIKCPESWTHTEYLIDGVVPAQYIPQMMWQMACGGPEIEFVDFSSFDPRVKKEDAQMFIRRLDRDERAIGEMEDAAVQFLEELAVKAETAMNNIKFPGLEDKLRESVKKSRGQYTHEDAELIAAFNEDFVP